MFVEKQGIFCMDNISKIFSFFMWNFQKEKKSQTCQPALDLNEDFAKLNTQPNRYISTLPCFLFQN